MNARWYDIWIQRISGLRPAAWRSHDRGFWVVAYAYLVGMAFSTVPSPLYVLYQERDGFSQLTITLIFAAYAIGAITSLFLVGHLSDIFGRRRILLIALGLTVLIGGLFITSSGLALLLVARFLSGVAIGMITGTATAYLSELHAAARPGGGRERADVVAITAPMLGLGSGAVVAGLLAQFMPHPLQTPYGFFVALLLVAMLLVRLVPETAPPKAAAYRIRRIRLPNDRVRFLAASGTALTSFALLALFSSIAPSFIANTLQLPSRGLSGIVTFFVYAAGAVSPLFLMRASLHGLLSWGFRAMVSGLCILTLGVWLTNFPLFVAGGVVTGAAAGLLFKGCISTIAAMATPDARAETVAALFLMAYLGLSFPIVGLGIASHFVTATTEIVVFTTVFLAVVVTARPHLLAPLPQVPATEREG